MTHYRSKAEWLADCKAKGFVELNEPGPAPLGAHALLRVWSQVLRELLVAILAPRLARGRYKAALERYPEPPAQPRPYQRR